MGRQIALIQGHPDAHGGHFGHSLADAYVGAAEAAGHTVRCIDVAKLDFPLLRSKDDYESNPPPRDIGRCQETIAWAEHLVILYPMWLGSMPALLKGFLEQLLRPGFAYRIDGPIGRRKLLQGKSARIIVTMGMPVFFYRWYFGAHSVKNLKRNILGFCGIKPIAVCFIGRVESTASLPRESWLGRMRELGRAAR